MLASMLNPDLDPKAEATAAEMWQVGNNHWCQSIAQQLEEGRHWKFSWQRARIKVLCVKADIRYAQNQITSIVHDENYTAAKKRNKEKRQASTAQTFE